LKSKKIALVTDFGPGSHYVGQMKSLIESSELSYFDLTHDIEPTNIRQASQIIYDSQKYLPEDCVCICIVDPGVGSENNFLVIESDSGIFIGPKNGIFTHLALANDLLKIWAFDREKTIGSFSDIGYHTFHGRDLFIPFAIRMIKNSIAISDYGGDLVGHHDIISKDFLPAGNAPKIIGEMVYRDSFGNIISNIQLDSGQRFRATLRDRYIIESADTYGLVSEMTPVAYIGSDGFLQIAINRGNAAKEFGMRNGQKIICELLD